MGISWLSPWFLLGAAAVAVPIVLHLLARHTAPQIEFPATRFVPEAPVELRRKRRPVDWLLLALRCLALVLLALAFARPFLAGPAATAGATARLVAIDTSFSMAGAETWAAAQAAAADAIDGAPSGSPVAVAAFDERARIVSPLSVDRGAARAAVAALRPGSGATSYGAIAAPVAELPRGQPVEVVLVSDLQRTGLRAAIALPGSATLTVRAVTPPKLNLAVESLAREDRDLVAVVANHGLQARATVVRLAIDGRDVAQRPLTLEEGASLPVRFEGAAADRGIAAVRIDDGGGLAADDERYLVLDEPRPTLVWIAGDAGDAFYVDRALVSAQRRPRVTTRTMTPGELAAPIDGITPPDVLVLQSTRGLGDAARRTLRGLVERGAGLLIAAGPDVDAGVLSQIPGEGDGIAIAQADSVPRPAALVPIDVRHQAFAAYADRASAYAGIRFEGLVRLRPAAGDRILARFDNGLPALVERSVGRGRLLVIASDLGARWNQWPLSPTFVPWLHDVVGYLAARPADEMSWLVGAVPDGVAPAPGAHVLADGRRGVVNVDPRESAIDLATTAEVEAAVDVAPAAAAPAAVRAAAEEASQSWWRYLVAAMLAVVLVESAVGARP